MINENNRNDWRTRCIVLLVIMCLLIFGMIITSLERNKLKKHNIFLSNVFKDNLDYIGEKQTELRQCYEDLESWIDLENQCEQANKKLKIIK